MHVAWWVPFAFLAPALVGLVAFRVVPIGIALAGGFFGTSLMGETLFRGPRQLRGLFEDPSFWAGVRVTLLFNLLINPLQVALAFLLALLTFRPTRFVVTFRTLYFLPITTSIAVTAVLWNILLDPNVGPVNALLRAIGVPTQPFFRGEGRRFHHDRGGELARGRLLDVLHAGRARGHSSRDLRIGGARRRLVVAAHALHHATPDEADAGVRARGRHRRQLSCSSPPSTSSPTAARTAPPRS
jgi:hypothetical protein